MILKGNVMTCKYNSILICIIPMFIVWGSCSLRNKTYNLIVNYLCGNATTLVTAANNSTYDLETLKKTPAYAS